VSRRSILVFSVLLVAICVAKPIGQAIAGSDSPRFLYTVAPQYEPLAWMQGGDRFPSGATVFIRDGQRPLMPDFAASADPSVSFDGQRVLFAGKQKAQDPWQIWEIPITGGPARRITSGTDTDKDDCIRPFYLPEERIVYARKVAGRFVIEALDTSGGKPLPLTYSPASSLPADILRDGRILFESAYVVGTSAIPEIYAVYSDGSGVESYRCDHGTARNHAKQVGSGDVVFTASYRLAKFTSARAHQIEISAPAGDYAGEVAELPSGDWLLPWRGSVNDPYQLMLWTPGAAALRSLIKEQNANTLQPTLLAERPVPNRHPSGLHDWPNANLLCLNAYTSKYSFAPGSIHSVRFYTRDSSGSTRWLGTAPVERDGSFFVQVPNDQPLQIELLDSSGKTLKRQSGFFWMRRGEQRACVGCHAGPETAPENAVPMILLQSTTPADMTGATAQSSGGH
jgi:hypothetical protein